MMITIEMKLRRQTINDCSGSPLDDSHLKSVYQKEQLTRSASIISSQSVDHVDPLLAANNSSMDYVDATVTDQQLTGSRDICTTSLQSACQV